MSLKAVDFAVEPWNSFWPEAAPLAAAHRAEVGAHDPRPYVAQPELAAELVRSGGMFVVTARCDGALIGYLMVYLSPMLDAEGIAATQGPWYMAPEHRRGSVGIRLFDEAMAEARRRGARWAFVHHWPSADGPKLERFFLSRGAAPTEKVFVMPLNGGL